MEIKRGITADCSWIMHPPVRCASPGGVLRQMCIGIVRIGMPGSAGDGLG